METSGYGDMVCMMCYGTKAALWWATMCASGRPTPNARIDFVDADSPRAVVFSQTFRELRNRFGR